MLIHNNQLLYYTIIIISKQKWKVFFYDSFKSRKYSSQTCICLSIIWQLGYAKMEKSAFDFASQSFIFDSAPIRSKGDLIWFVYVIKINTVPEKNPITDMSFYKVLNLASSL